MHNSTDPSNASRHDFPLQSRVDAEDWRDAETIELSAPAVAAIAAQLANTPAPAAAAARDPERPADPPAVHVGRVLRDRYVVERLLGSGGMGEVYKASAGLGVPRAECPTPVAVKVLRDRIERRPDLMQRLQREFDCMRSLSHPNVVKVYEFERNGQFAFYTMELLAGEHLGALLGRAPANRLPRPYAWSIIGAIGAALAHAHSRNVVHGDLSPKNVMITRDGEVRVLDFGSSTLSQRPSPASTSAAALGSASRLAPESDSGFASWSSAGWAPGSASGWDPESGRGSALGPTPESGWGSAPGQAPVSASEPTSRSAGSASGPASAAGSASAGSGSVAATPAYASCEVLEGQRADARDDLYALACLAYELLAGEHPFQGRRSTDARDLGMTPRRPPGVSRSHWRSLRRGLAWTRAERSITLREWLATFGLEPQPERLPTLPPHDESPARFYRAPLAKGVALGLAVLAGAALAWHSSKTSPDVISADVAASAEPPPVPAATAPPSTHADTDTGALPVAAPVAAPPAVARAEAAPPFVTPPEIEMPPQIAAHEVAPTRMLAPRLAPVASRSKPRSIASRARAIAPRQRSLTAHAHSKSPRQRTMTAKARSMAPTGGSVIRFTVRRYSPSPRAQFVETHVRRLRSSGATQFVWWTDDSSAKAGVDFVAQAPTPYVFSSGRQFASLFVRLMPNPGRTQEADFHVCLGKPGSGSALTDVTCSAILLPANSSDPST